MKKAHISAVQVPVELEETVKYVETRALEIEGGVVRHTSRVPVLSIHPLGVLKEQLVSLFKLAKQLGVTASTFASLSSDVVRNELPGEMRAGFASPAEGLSVLLADAVDVGSARSLYRKPDPVTKSAITEKIRDGKIIAYRTGAGEYRVPGWQFRPEGGVVDGIAETLKVLRGAKTYSQVTPFVFLLQENPMTGNLTPLDALKKGKLEAVLAAAREHA